MNELERYRKLHSSKKSPKKHFGFINRLLVLLLLLVTVLITAKVNPTFGTWLKNNVYSKNFSFANIESIYNKYMGLITGDVDTTQVFANSITYTGLKDYYDGVELSVDSNTPINSMMSGVVVYIGEKENYGPTVIISQVNGVEVWYGNVTVNDIKLYDYVEKDKILGSTTNNKLYLVFMKNGNLMDYKEYVS